MSGAAYTDRNLMDSAVWFPPDPKSPDYDERIAQCRSLGKHVVTYTAGDKDVAEDLLDKLGLRDVL